MAAENNIDVGLIESLATTIGATDNALRLLISLFACYPLGFLHRIFFYGKPPWLQHLYFTICGLALGYFNFGFYSLHSLANIVGVYIILLLFGGTSSPLGVILTLSFNMAYLVIGYYWVMSPVYTVSWTTPQCVLTLRLMGLAFDVFDGKRKPESLSAEQKETALAKMPTLLEVLGHNFYFGGYLVGPQFPMTRYQSFINGAFSDKVTGGPPACVQPALLRLLSGITYTVLYQVGALYFPDQYLTSSDYAESSFLYRAFFVLCWGKFTLYKYLACWLIAEGSCIITGLTYHGRDENGNDLWDACANIKIRQYERAPSCGKYIECFNINTNKWMAKYCFKRLRFLGNKDLSQALTMIFLALWHGLYTGYFMCFFLEFIIMKFEKELWNIMARNQAIVDFLSISYVAPAVWCLKKIYAQFALSYALVGFCLFTVDKYMQVYSQLYFCLHIVMISWPLVLQPIVRKLLLPRRHAENGTAKHQKEQ